jgi:hypothetical protein
MRKYCYCEKIYLKILTSLRILGPLKYEIVVFGTLSIWLIYCDIIAGSQNGGARRKYHC